MDTQATQQFGPDEVQEPNRSNFLTTLLGKRKDAISARSASGIEEEWTEDEEHYQGIDDANRMYAATTSGHAKRWATNDRADNAQANRSVVFLNITAPYVDSASANVAEKLLPTDDRSWEIKPTPVTTAMRLAYGQAGIDTTALEQMIADDKQRAEAMQQEVDDHLVESNWHGEVRQIIEDAARIGTGVLKGPFPRKVSSSLSRVDPATGAKAIVKVSETKPATKRVDPWLFWPDGGCGENVQHGSYCWELEYISQRQLIELIDMPGYDRQAIIAAVREGPSKTATVPREAGDGTYIKSDDQYELWIFHGTVKTEDVEESGLAEEDDFPKVPVMAVIVNDRLIKAARNVLDGGELPYDVLAWQRRPGMPWGTGISRKLRTAQRILNGGVRAMMDNAGLSAGVQIVLGAGITPADKLYTITGRKLWRAEPDVQDVRQQFMAFVPPSVQAELMNIVQWAMKVAEDVTGMPAMLQGIRGDSPDTLGGMEMAQNNSSSILRRIAKRMDDYVTEPHITRYYEWMMQHSQREDIKGDFNIEVRASSALVARDMQQQFLMQLLTVSRDPAYEISPKKLAEELLKGKQIDPKRVQYDEEEKAALQEKPDPLTQARVALTAAQTKVAEATAVTKNVEGMYSATTAANLVASNPLIAPSSDQILMSAGFVDADASPIIAPVNAPAIPIQENTNPMTPPNPDVGMGHGIEVGNTPI